MFSMHVGSGELGDVGFARPVALRRFQPKISRLRSDPESIKQPDKKKRGLNDVTIWMANIEF